MLYCYWIQITQIHPWKSTYSNLERIHLKKHTLVFSAAINLNMWLYLFYLNNFETHSELNLIKKIRHEFKWCKENCKMTFFLVYYKLQTNGWTVCIYQYFQFWKNNDRIADRQYKNVNKQTTMTWSWTENFYFYFIYSTIEIAIILWLIVIITYYLWVWRIYLIIY